MDRDEHPDFSTIKFSNSPRRFTRITPSLGSPVRSVHPEQERSRGHMESIDSQADFGHRTADFLDVDSSDDETKILPGTALESTRRERSRSPAKRKQPPPSAQSFVSRCEPKRVSLPPDSDGYQRLDSNLNQQIPIENARRGGTPSTVTSFNGSVTELLGENEENDAPQHPRPARLPSNQTAQSTKRWTMDQEFQHRTSQSSDKLDQRLGVHAIAYDLLLRGLLTDEEVMRGHRPASPLASRLSGIRSSMLPPALRSHDPRSPKDHLFPNGGVDRNAPGTGGNGKKVQVVPPPIDTTAPQRSLPADMVRTPYPHSYDRIYRKDFDREPPSAMESPMGATESVLTLSIRKSNPNSKTRVTSLTIPASNDYSAVRTNKAGGDEKCYRAADFDDAEFFNQLRLAYRQLSSTPIRLFSARKLTRIVVSGPASRAADAGYGWLLQPRSPRILAYNGLTDTFSEEKILQHYRKPALGKSRYAFVHWAHRLAAAPPPTRPTSPPASGEEVPQPSPQSRELLHRIEQPEGLELIMSWSISRILLALTIVVVFSLAAILLWTFLGKNTPSQMPASAGFKGAGDRVGTGVLIGIVVFLIGLGMIAGWLGISWLVI
ncbi:Hypothetical predicted protein [Lecanosticta acicola]|uniref:Uncharacterized protein n=1 Tax=Lecanosticta acicola TaxID=111012 RepID=A0AAI9E928_9PEZI|nr:Hypothetical predicted protein [Lecanosticta acicola]